MPTSVTWNNTVRSIPNSGELSWQALTGFLADLGNNAQTTNFQRFGTRIATTSPVTVVAATDCIVVSDLGTPGAVAVNLPAGSTGQLFCVVDGKGDAATNNITITPNAGTINGAATYVIDGDRNGIILVYNGTEWTILSEFIASSGTGSIPRDQIAAGSAGHVIINDGSGLLSSEAQLAITRGGTGQSTAQAAFDALSPTTTRGDLITQDASNDVRLAIGTASTVLKSDGTDPSWGSIVDANVDAAAAVARSKLAVGTADHVVINNGSGVLSSEAQLAVTRGGTGVSTSTGSGSVVLSTSPTLVTPLLGTPTSGVMTNVTGLPLTSGVTGTLPIGNGGTGQTTQTAAFDALDPLTTKGDIIAHDGTNSIRRPVGTDGFALIADSTHASGLNYAAVATSVTTTRGDMIRRGAATDERFSASTDNRVVRGDGTDAVSGQIDDPDFFTTGAAASSSAIGIVTTAAQSFAGLKKFHGGLIQVSSVIATDANATLSNTDPRHITFTGFTTTRTVALPQTTILAGEVFTLVNASAADMAVTASAGGAIDTIRAGHITLVALQAGPSLAAHWRVVFLDESYALSTTFTPTTSGGSTATGSTPTGSVTLKARRWGSGSSKQVSVLFPATTTTDPGSNAVALVQTTALPIRFASNGSIGMGGTYPVRDNAGGSNTVGLVVMGSDAKVYLYRNYSQSLFTDNAAAGVDTAVAGGGVSLTFFNDP